MSIKKNSISKCNLALPSEQLTEIRILMILFGTIEYDGRAQRMYEILSSLGNVTLLDISLKGEPIDHERKETLHSRVNLSGCKLKITRHLRLWSAAIRIARDYRPNLVVAENFFTTFPAWVAAKLVKARIVYDAYELIIPEPGQKMNRRDAFWYYLERWMVKRNDLTIAANPERANLMAKHYGLKRIPEYMRNIPSTPALDTLNDSEIEGRYLEFIRVFDGGTIILYQGYISLSRGLERFIESLEFLPTRYRMVFVGDGPDLDRCKQLGARWAQEERFIALGRVPNSLLHAVTRRADVGIVTYPSMGLNNIYCAPNKLFEYTQAGLPVIATDHPPLKALVTTYGIGVLIARIATSAEVAIALEQLVRDKEKYKANLARFVDAHQWDGEADRVRRAIQSVCDTVEIR